MSFVPFPCYADQSFKVIMWSSSIYNKIEYISTRPFSRRTFDCRAEQGVADYFNYAITFRREVYCTRQSQTFVGQRNRSRKLILSVSYELLVRTIYFSSTCIKKRKKKLFIICFGYFLRENCRSKIISNLNSDAVYLN